MFIAPYEQPVKCQYRKEGRDDMHIVYTNVQRHVSRRGSTPVVHLETLVVIFSRSDWLILGRSVGRDAAWYRLDGDAT